MRGHTLRARTPCEASQIPKPRTEERTRPSRAASRGATAPRRDELHPPRRPLSVVLNFETQTDGNTSLPANNRLCVRVTKFGLTTARVRYISCACVTGKTLYGATDVFAARDGWTKVRQPSRLSTVTSRTTDYHFASLQRSQSLLQQTSAQCVFREFLSVALLSSVET